jgi:pimeloyl-ACP methyl ester carboxylesterase
VLVVWGERDRVFPAAHAARAQAVVPGAEVRIVAGVGHAPQVEDPAAFAAIVRDFLARTGV